MTTITNLNKNICKAGIGFNLREDLNFTDDGNRFRGFDYKGLPITTCRSDGETYLAIRVDYLEGKAFTVKEWMATEEYHLANEFNGVDEIDLEKLIDNCERIIAKVAEMNEKAEAEEIDMTDVKNKVALRIFREENALEMLKNVRWWEMKDYDLHHLKMCADGLTRDIEYLRSFDFDKMSRVLKKWWVEYTDNGCGNDWYVSEIEKACE